MPRNPESPVRLERVGRYTHRGEPKDGNFRVTHIAVDTPDGWRLAGIHLSPIM